jgi:diguanylate cyclase (GGDEF)-like protein
MGCDCHIETIERELARARREKHSVSIAIADIDHFKAINDRHGHEAGDLVLQALAGLLTRCLRSSDVACRYGGEEFVILIPRADLEVAHKRADAWRAEFESLRTRAGDEEVAATLSVGVASFPMHGDDGESVLRAADRALYRSKAGGRNRTTVAPLEPPTFPPARRTPGPTP